jgi:group I intron endonuclease
MESKVYIYTLEHPETGVIRYIGKTINPSHRLKSHLWTKNKSLRTKKSNWIQSLKVNGLKPIMRILDEVSESNWSDTEKYWIEQFRQWGFELYNGNEGGIGSPGRKHTVEERAKMTQARYNELAILAYSLNGQLLSEHATAKEASIVYGIKASAVSNCASHRGVSSVNGIMYRKKSEGAPSQEELDYAIAVRSEKKKPLVINYNNGSGVVFKTVEEAHKITGLSHDFIRERARGDVPSRIVNKEISSIEFL